MISILTVLLSAAGGALLMASLACLIMAWRILSAPARSFENAASLSGKWNQAIRGDLSISNDHLAIQTSGALAYDLKTRDWVDEARLADEAVDAAHAR